jgi:hypothetical protein
VTNNFGGHTLASLALLQWGDQRLQIGMGVKVDEAGANNATVGLDTSLGRGARQPANRRNPIS